MATVRIRKPYSCERHQPGRGAVVTRPVQARCIALTLRRPRAPTSPARPRRRSAVWDASERSRSRRAPPKAMSNSEKTMASRSNRGRATSTSPTRPKNPERTRVQKFNREGKSLAQALIKLPPANTKSNFAPWRSTPKSTSCTCLSTANAVELQARQQRRRGRRNLRPSRPNQKRRTGRQHADRRERTRTVFRETESVADRTGGACGRSEQPRHPDLRPAGRRQERNRRTAFCGPAAARKRHSRAALRRQPELSRRRQRTSRKNPPARNCRANSPTRSRSRRAAARSSRWNRISCGKSPSRRMPPRNSKKKRSSRGGGCCSRQPTRREFSGEEGQTNALAYAATSRKKAASTPPRKSRRAENQPSTA